MTEEYITRLEFEARMSDMRNDIKDVKTGVDKINDKLDQAKESKLTTIKDIVLAVIAGGGLTAIIELIMRR